MKLQLDEQTLNAYINEAIRQELDEGLFSLGRKAAQKGGQEAIRTITHSPITKKFFGRAKNAKEARKFVMALRRGKWVGGTVESGKSTKGLQWFTKDGKTFFTKGADGKMQEITNKQTLNAVKGSFQGHLTTAKNLFNSAQRNMLGTTAVAGLGAGWAIDHNLNKGKGDNGGDDTSSADDGGQDGNPGANDGGFPWDNTEPVMTPRPPRTPRPTPPSSSAQQQEPAAPERPKLEPLAPITQIQGQATAAPQTIQIKQQDPTLAQSAVRVMGQTANASNMGLNDRKSTNRRTRQNAINAIDSMQRSGAMTRDQARADKRLVRGAERSLRAGKPMSE